MFKKGFFIAGILAVLSLLCACSGQNGSAPNQSSEQREAADPSFTQMDVVLDWYPNAIHAFLYDAQEKGYFAEEGLSVNLITPAESVDAVNFVASGRAQVGLTYPIDVIQAYEAGMPVTALGAVSQKALDCMCALSSNADITEDLSTLKGKKIGYAGTQVSKAVVDTVTQAAGLKPEDYELLNVGFDLVTSLTTKNADLVVGTFINDEIVTMQHQGYDLQVFSEQDYGVPELYGLIFAVNQKAYEKDPESYEGFLRACRKGFDDIKGDEIAAMELIMNSIRSEDNPLDEEQQRESYEILMPLMEPEEGDFLSMQEKVWENIISWMKQTGQIKGDVKVADILVH